MRIPIQRVFIASALSYTVDKHIAMTESAPQSRVLVAGALTNTGQLVARSLSKENFDVKAMCTPDVGGSITDDTGSFRDTNVRPSGRDVLVDKLVIATDSPPPVPALQKLLETCDGVEHVVLLSRLGASTGAGGLAAWQEAEEAASACCPKLTIVRLGEPLLGGPYHARDVDMVRFRTASVADLMLSAQVKQGDSLTQSGFGSSRIVAASAIASALRRGPEQQASYSVVSDANSEPTTSEQFDEMFAKAAGGAAAAAAAGDSDADAESRGPTQVQIDLRDEVLRPFTQPYVPPPPTPLEFLKQQFFGNPAVAGPNWFILVFFVFGLWQCAQPDYIARTGVDVFGLADQYGIQLTQNTLYQ